MSVSPSAVNAAESPAVRLAMIIATVFCQFARTESGSSPTRMGSGKLGETGVAAREMGPAERSWAVR